MSKLTFSCLRCGRDYHPWPYQVKNGKGYCSLDCVHPPLIRNCERCGRDFRVQPCQVARGKGRYCSVDCVSPPMMRQCVRCGQDFRARPCAVRKGWDRFCSTECMQSLTPDQRFWEQAGQTDDPAACWLWQGYVMNTGYGQFWLGTGRAVTEMLAHRFSWELHNGRSADGFFVCHSCDVRRCVNPAHLWLGTPRENSQDCVSKDRQAKGSKNGCAKLTEAAAPVIRRRYAAGGVSLNKLAAEYGVGPETVRKVVHLKSWKHTG